MRLTLLEVRRICRAIARENHQVDIGQVAASDGGSDHVEILLTVHRPDHDPRLVEALVRRTDRETLERDLRRRIAALTRSP